jgi:hypothetical protein
MIYYNTTTNKFRKYVNGAWQDLINTTDAILNQNASAQTGTFWINGNGQIDGSLRLYGTTPSIELFSSGGYNISRSGTDVTFSSGGAHIFKSNQVNFKNSSNVNQLIVGGGTYALDAVGAAKIEGLLYMGTLAADPTG